VLIFCEIKLALWGRMPPVNPLPPSPILFSCNLHLPILSRHLLKKPFKMRKPPQSRDMVLSNDIPVGLAMSQAIGNPHLQPRPVLPHARPAKGLRAFRCMAVSTTIRIASPRPRHVPRGHGVRGAVRP